MCRLVAPERKGNMNNLSGMTSGYCKNKTEKLSRVINRYGGKGSMYKMYLPYIKDMAMKSGATIFVDAFGGGGTMSFAAETMMYPKSSTPLFKKIIFNDIEKPLVALFTAVKDEKMCPELVKSLLNTPYSIEEFRRAQQCLSEDAGTNAMNPNFELARAYFIVNHQSYNSACKTFRDFKNYTYKNDRVIDYDKRFCADAMNLLSANKHLQRIEIRNQSYDELLAEFQTNSNAMTFLDPPYLFAERNQGALECYQNEFGDVAHIVLGGQLRYCRNWILCGYHGKANEADSLIYSYIENIPDVKFVDMGARYRPSSGISMQKSKYNPHEAIWTRL